MQPQNFIDLTGQTFGRLTVIHRRENTKAGIARWECRCECGKITVCRGSHLRSGKIHSCRCLHNEIMGHRNHTHGMTNTPEYDVWAGMVQRCTNSRNEAFKNYGERGITIHESWLKSFNEFYEYVGQRPTLQHTIERIDNNLGYFPGNVKWATRNEQASNRRSNIIITFNGKTMNLTEWSAEIGINKRTLQQRISLLKWPIKKALTEPIHNNHPQSHIPRSSESPIP